MRLTESASPTSCVQTLTEIRSLLAARGVRPKHRLGQNFLHDHNVLRKLLDAAGLPHATAGDVSCRASIPPTEARLDDGPPLVLEVGPGTGALTEMLLERGARVIACEIDRDMIDILEERVMPRAGGRLTIVQGDCLDGKHALSAELRAALRAHSAQGATATTATPFRLVSNLPYGSATPLLATLLVDHPECDGLFATIQREVADRLLAAPRSEAYGAISVNTALLARVQRVMDVAPGCFWPAPDVTSAIVAIHPHGRADRPSVLRDRPDIHAFQRFVGSAFSKRRKQLGAILGRSAPLPAGVEARQRPEELAPSQWVELWSLNRATDSLSVPSDDGTPCE